MSPGTRPGARPSSSIGPKIWSSACRCPRRSSLLASRPRLARAPKPFAAVPANTPRLKLYQPAHQRFYVAAATLACAIPGLPDRKLAGGHEQVGFVLRRLMPASKDAPAGSPLFEYGFVKDATGARWQRVAEGDEGVLVPGEERLPAFPLAHQDGHGLKRTMWGGLIPVGRREQYLSATITRTARRLVEGQVEALQGAAPGTPRNSKLARTTEFKIDFAEPWKALIQAVTKATSDLVLDTDSKATAGNKQLSIRKRNWGYQSQSWLLLLDLMAFLDRHLPTVAQAVRQSSAGTLSGDKLALYTWFSGQMSSGDRDKLNNGFKPDDADNANRPEHVRSLAEALRQVAKPGVAALLEGVETQYRDHKDDRAKWPAFHYLLAGIATNDGGGMASSRRAPSAASLRPIRAPCRPRS